LSVLAQAEGILSVVMENMGFAKEKNMEKFRTSI
jgi:hypothetical protein